MVSGMLRVAIDQQIKQLEHLIALARGLERTYVIGNIQAAIRELEYAKNKPPRG